MALTWTVGPLSLTTANEADNYFRLDGIDEYGIYPFKSIYGMKMIDPYEEYAYNDNSEEFHDMNEQDGYDDMFDPFEANDGENKACTSCGINEMNETIWRCRHAGGGCGYVFCGKCFYEHECDNSIVMTPGPEMLSESLAVFQQIYGEELKMPGPAAAEKKEIEQLDGTVFDMDEPEEASEVRKTIWTRSSWTCT